VDFKTPESSINLYIPTICVPLLGWIQKWHGDGIHGRMRDNTCAGT